MNLSSGDAAKILVWPWYIRLFHWLLVASVFAAFFTAEDTVTTHQVCGYVVMALVAFRIFLGFFSRNELLRFQNFFPYPGKVAKFLQQLIRGKEERYLGHNPASGAMILTLLVLLGFATLGGTLLALEIVEDSDLFKEAHEVLGYAVICLVPIHVAGAIFTSFTTQENLIKGMITGRKRR